MGTQVVQEDRDVDVEMTASFERRRARKKAELQRLLAELAQKGGQ
mgnify:CR=1 FL=1